MSVRTLHIIWLMLFFIAFTRAAGQEPVISVSTENQPLDRVLEELTTRYGVKFAYDAGTFHQIRTSFFLQDVKLAQFLHILETRYGVDYENIDGTWVMIKQKSQPVPEEPPPPPQMAFVSGYVKDLETRSRLIYCNVAAGKGMGGMTNEIGFFNFRVPYADSVRISVSHLGYKKQDTIVSTGIQHDIFLEPSDIFIDPVRVVHSEKQILQASSQPGQIAFNPLKSADFPRISNDDLSNALVLIPGINFLQGGASGLSVRGSDPTDNLILFDGIPVLETSHLLGNMSVLNAKFVHQAFVSRGGFDASYGDRVSGLFQLTGKSGKNRRPSVDLSANLLNLNLLANIPVTEKFSVTAAWRRSYIDRWQNYLYYRLIDDVVSNEEDPVTSTIIPTIHYQDFNAKVSFHPSDKLELDVNILYGKDDQSRDFELVQTRDYYRNEKLNSENLGMSFNWKWQMNDHWFHSFSAGFSTLEKEMIDETGELKEITEVIEHPGQGVGQGKGLAKTKERTYSRLIFDVDNGFNEIESYRASWKMEYDAGMFKNEVGAGWTSDSYRYNFFASRTRETVQIDSIASKAELNMLNAFFQQKIAFHDDFNFRWGIRANMDMKQGNKYWQPRGGIEFVPEEALNIYFFSGVYYQFLTGVRRYDSEGHMNRIWYLPGDEGQGIVKGTHQVLGTKWEKNGWYVDFEAYRKNAAGKISFFAELSGTDNEQVISYSPHETLERSRGLDLFIQKRHLIFNHMIGYSFAKAEEKIPKMTGDSWVPGFNDRTHRLKMTEMLRWKKWRLTGSWQMATGLPVFRYSDQTLHPDFFRSESFSQVDFALVKQFDMAHLSLRGGVSLLNVFNRPNVIEVNYLRFSSDVGSLTVRSDISALGFTPLFFVNVQLK